MIPVILYTFSSFILQITNRIKEYAKLILFERLTFVFVVVLYLVCGFRSYIGLFYIDLFGKILAMLFGIYLIKGILVFNFTKFTVIIAEICENVNVGSKLLFANIASMLILGIIRFGISQYWNVVTFGKISLALSIANFFLKTSCFFFLSPIQCTISFGGIAQLVEHLHGMQGVSGSNPLTSTTVR